MKKKYFSIFVLINMNLLSLAADSWLFPGIFRTPPRRERQAIGTVKFNTIPKMFTSHCHDFSSCFTEQTPPSLAYYCYCFIAFQTFRIRFHTDIGRFLHLFGGW